tara:strand:+ start:64 stop:540 length:477 start_codon:yes stop_codon:yes gene_type:complete
LAEKLSNMIDDLTSEQLLIAFGSEMADRIIDRTQDGKDVRGRKFKAYSKKYFEAKRDGEFVRQASQFKPSSRKDVNLTLTTDMLNSLKVKRVSKKKVTIGMPPQEAVKANSNERLGRAISTTKRPISKDDEKFVDKFFNKRIVSAMNQNSGTVSITIG